MGRITTTIVHSTTVRPRLIRAEPAISTNDPCFVNAAGENYRLQSNSPCINTGTNQSWMIGAMDLDGNPRISPASGIVDMGAYEYLWGGSVIPSWWLEQYGLPTDGSADYEDKDGDGFNNWQEWRCDTVPTDSDSFLKFDSLTCTSIVAGFVIRWASVTSRTYMVGRSTNLIVQPPFVKMGTNILGQPQTTSYTDTTAAVSGPSLFYRVGVGSRKGRRAIAVFFALDYLVISANCFAFSAASVPLYCFTRARH